MNSELSSKKIIRDLGTVPSHLKKLLGKQKEYDAFLRLLLQEEYFCRDDAYTPPKISHLVNKYANSYERIRKFLVAIYNELVLDVEGKLGFDIPEVEYNFNLKVNGRYLSLNADSLPVVPRVGEQIYLPLFNSYSGTDLYYVEDILYWFFDSKQTIDIIIKPGNYNLYWRFIKDKAIEENEIGFLEALGMTNEEMKAKLKRTDK